MWIKCPNGIPTLVRDQAHIARLLSEGGEAIPDPTINTLARVEEGAESVLFDTPNIPGFEDLSEESGEPGTVTEAKRRGRPPKSAQ